MKKMLLFIAAVAILAACSKKESSENTVDKWNGYGHLKNGEWIQTLWAGQNENVGTVTYYFDEDAATFTATYSTVDGWEIRETHFFADNKNLMPTNKKYNPKLGHFPFKDDWAPGETEVIYSRELQELPPNGDPGFVAAAHAVVYNINSNQEETAWAEGNLRFNDKSWGWYTTEWFNQDENLYSIFYTTSYNPGTGKMTVYRIDATNNETELFDEETFSPAPDAIDGNAYDPVSSNFFFTTTENNVSTLHVLNLLDDDQSFPAGELEGIASSGTFNDGHFIYVNEDNEIQSVNFDDDWLIDTESNLDEISSTDITVKDIAYAPDGKISIIGLIDNEVKLRLLNADYSIVGEDKTITNPEDPTDETSPNAQIAYGDSDTELYMFEGSPLGGGVVSTLSPTTGQITTTIDIGLIPIDPFGDFTFIMAL